MRLPERELTGRFDGLDETGRLLVHGPSGKRDRSPRATYFGLAIG